ncbi:hypothetical protein V6N12_051187 [Hibiscus sabdariffa]|uniref:Uncharacterized protein n=1 Tax=Hibiscus sabdariffa TaxID=183260 RepID=A0ABR2GF76_9ROSI
MGFSIKDWVYANLRNAGEFVYNVADWDILFGSLLWSLWLPRNDVVFNKHQERRESVIDEGIRLQQKCIASRLCGISSRSSVNRARRRIAR